MTVKYDPLEDRILILPIKKTEEEKTASGLIDVSKKETAEGIVVANGAGYTARDTGVFVQTVLAVGDKVLYGIHAGMPLEVPNEKGEKVEHRLMRESDVLCLLSKKG